MHDEFERAVTGKSRSGLSPLAWFGIVFAFMVVVGAVGVGFVVKRVVSQTMAQVEEIVDEIASGRLQPAAAAAEMVGRLRSRVALVSAEPDEGLAYLRSLDAGDPSEAVVEDLVEGAFRFRTDGGQVSGQVEGSEEGGNLTIRSGEGTVRMDLTRDEDGGSLVIDSEDGQVRFDLRRTEDGGFLSIDSKDGQVRFDLRKTDNGGFLVIDSDDGQVRFDLTGGEDGGQLVIRTDDETLRFGIGDEADAMPRWVPRLDGMPRRPRPVYSLDSDEGFLGAVAWEARQSPDEVLAYYQDVLEAEGYELEADARLNVEDDQGGGLWARNADADRMVFVVVREERGQTKVLLGYGDKR